MSSFGQELWYPAQPSGCPDKFEIPFFTQSKQIWDQRRKLVLRLTYLSLLKLGKKCVADLGPNLALKQSPTLNCKGQMPLFYWYWATPLPEKIQQKWAVTAQSMPSDTRTSVQEVCKILSAGELRKTLHIPKVWNPNYFLVFQNNTWSSQTLNLTTWEMKSWYCKTPVPCRAYHEIGLKTSECNLKALVSAHIP